MILRYHADRLSPLGRGTYLWVERDDEDYTGPLQVGITVGFDPTRPDLVIFEKKESDQAAQEFAVLRVVDNGTGHCIYTTYNLDHVQNFIANGEDEEEYVDYHAWATRTLQDAWPLLQDDLQPPANLLAALHRLLPMTFP